MALISFFSGDTLSAFLRRSNYWAEQNRNAYPVKIANAVSALYDWIDCPCTDDCECKNYSCKKHLIRKTAVPFNIYHDHFLKCYVDSKAQKAVRDGRTSGRGYKAVEVTKNVHSNWGNISAVTHNKHLLCSDWSNPIYESLARSFKVSSETIYHAKWMSLICFDIYVAYDIGSAALLKRDFNNPTDYHELIKRIRQDIIHHLRQSCTSLQSFREYDNPSEFFSQIPNNSPRAIGNVIDKLYLTL